MLSALTVALVFLFVIVVFEIVVSPAVKISEGSLSAAGNSH